MRIVAIAGSPRRNGNSDILLQRFLEGARSAGAEAAVVTVSDRDIHPCTECLGCAEEGVCVFKDDMEEVEKLLLSADGIVVASPVFFYGLPARLKAMIDRGQALWERRRLKGAPLRSPVKVFVLMVGATRGKKLFDGALLTLRYFFQPLNGRISGSILVRGVDKRGEISTRPDTLEVAFKAGKKFAGAAGR